MRSRAQRQGHDRVRRVRQSWRAIGWTVVPNLAIVNPSLPPIARLILQALHARSFGKGSVRLSVETIGRDVGVSRQTAHKYLNLLEMEGLIERRRQGLRRVNLIVLKLRKVGQSVKSGLEEIVPVLRDRLFDGRKHTVAWWVERYRVWKEAMGPARGMKVAA